MNFAEVLKGCHLFEGWSTADLKKLEGIVKTRDLTPGESLFVQGEDSDCFYIVGSGTLSISKFASGEEQSVTNIGPNSTLGELAMLRTQGPAETRSAGASAAEPSSVIEIPFAPFEKMLADTPNLGMLYYKNVAIVLAARIRRTTEDLAGLRALRLRHV